MFNGLMGEKFSTLTILRSRNKEQPLRGIETLLSPPSPAILRLVEIKSSPFGGLKRGFFTPILSPLWVPAWRGRESSPGVEIIGGVVRSLKLALVGYR